MSGFPFISMRFLDGMDLLPPRAGMIAIVVNASSLLSPSAQAMKARKDSRALASSDLASIATRIRSRFELTAPIESEPTLRTALHTRQRRRRGTMASRLSCFAARIEKFRTDPSGELHHLLIALGVLGIIFQCRHAVFVVCNDCTTENA